MNPPTLPDYIKAGAVVKLRDGSKAHIYALDKGSHFPIHGAVFRPEHGSWVQESWTREGNYRLPQILKENGWDIISAWTDTPDCSKLWPLLPPWIKWIAQDEDGIWRGHMYKPDLKGCCWESSANSWMWYIIIPQEYQPIFEGDWKDSLVERPQ